MLSLFKKLFGKAAPKDAVPAASTVPLAPSTPMPTIEVAQLSLGAITCKFPEELKPLLAGEPVETATVTLPMPTILKQLPSGCVKMSLATLQRQSHGLIKPIPPGDKRMVDVPLKEVFRHVRLSSLKRREQRTITLPDTGFNLFGDSSNPYAISPDDHLEQIQVVDLTPDAEAVGGIGGFLGTSRVLKMDDAACASISANTPAAHSGSSADSPALRDQIRNLRFGTPGRRPARGIGRHETRRRSGADRQADRAHAQSEDRLPVRQLARRNKAGDRGIRSLHDRDPARQRCGRRPRQGTRRLFLGPAPRLDEAFRRPGRPPLPRTPPCNFR